MNNQITLIEKNSETDAMTANRERDKELTTKQERFLKVYASKSCNVSKACKAAKIARSTYYDWVNNSDTFRQKREEAEEGLYDHVEDALLQQINNGNITAIIFFAKTKMKDRGYVERREFTGKNGDAIMDKTKTVFVGVSSVREGATKGENHGISAKH